MHGPLLINGMAHWQYFSFQFYFEQLSKIDLERSGGELIQP